MDSYTVPPYGEETHHVVQHLESKSQPRQQCATEYGSIVCDSCDFFLANEGDTLKVGDKCKRCGTPIIAFDPIQS